MTISKNKKMMGILNHRLRITLSDGRQFTGQMLAFDKHMNLVLSDCEELRRVKSSAKVDKDATTRVREIKRMLGLVILRGDTVVSLSVDGPPPVSVDAAHERARLAAMPVGPGLARPASRAVPLAAQPPMAAPPGLAGPVRGVGGPIPSMMQPRAPGIPPPGSFARPPPVGVPGMPQIPTPIPGPPPPGYRPAQPTIPGFRPMPPGVVPPPGAIPGMRPPPGGPGAPPPGYHPPPGYAPRPPPGH
ncbi:hypothetical protein BB560_000216 [Smittium megazygosporum]|uniref:Sm protein B n=1 Tax=Smittium megazygosporum TaxID=133381 RepID=A0A2T9ZL06_9FUNG|nr:hypothetical protein BB560_000216 [Smittium megazygosporum]